MKFPKFRNSLILGTSLLALVACGGGEDSGDGGSPPPAQNNIPTVEADDSSVFENTTVSIIANGQDSDGTISAYSWTQKSGVAAVLSGIDSATVSLTAPSVVENSEILLSVSVTDNDGAVASTDVTVSIMANILTTTLNGLITDISVEGTNVSVDVGGQVFTVAADNTGAYSLELALDDSFSDNIVSVTATGVEPNAPLKLVSMLGDFGTVVNSGGPDNIVTSNELFGVNISPVSTAFAALLEDANNNLPVSTIREFSSAKLHLDSSLILSLAKAVKLVLDYSTNNVVLELPTGFTNTNDLVRDIQKTSEYMTKASIHALDYVVLAENDIWSNDNNFFSGLPGNVIPFADTYYQLNFAQANDSGGRFILLEDGSGQMIIENAKGELNWVSSGKNIDLSFGEIGIVVSVSFRFGLTPTGQVEEQLIFSGKNIRWLNRSETLDTILYKEIYFLHYPNGELEDTIPYEVFGTESYAKEMSVINASETLEMNVTYSIPNTVFSQSIVDPISLQYHDVWATEAKFAGNVSDGGIVTYQIPALEGDGTVNYEDEVRNWNVDPRGHLIIFDGKSTIDIVFLDNQDGFVPTINSVTTNTDTNTSQANSHNILLQISDWNETAAVGIYDFGLRFSHPWGRSWMEIYSGGSGAEFSSLDLDENGEISEDEIFERPKKWRINEEGNIVIRSYRSILEFGDCVATEFEPAIDDDCVLYHERELDLFQVTDNNEYHLRHMNRFFDDRNRSNYPGVTSHILSIFASTGNRFWKKVDERPIQIANSKKSNRVVKPLKEDSFEGLIKQELAREAR